ncbi:MAG: nucleotidyltransferase domain-containing protein [Verrucomicrobia bacterium]|nr:nucleotidyltransferase domain-containing protein [Verrucomicrobiota bacterium]MCG2680522.1 nucleotidyltransferase domain-containing protein [Kiritimatiellia bacterium]MBU4248245.1 nucleotidyltransferase domain-containing protein [Verrucomicrobiota bacterium]MBU4290448.1 nucleotidyltransferase domain-containing protein [Verrucomicrobiota bacterium]MBU4428588.1 nucleotidyltransferase domain-containing protein [Verrucomicrobiota bacterium]
MRIEDIKRVAVRACREFNVRRLDAFGSTALGTAISSSDVDLIVEFIDPGCKPAKRFFGLLHQLEDALGCEVDLLTITSLRNPYFRSHVLTYAGAAATRDEASCLAPRDWRWRCLGE